METCSALLALCAGNSPVTGEFPWQRPVTRSLMFSLTWALNKRLNKQLWGWWFETPSRSLLRHCIVGKMSKMSVLFYSHKANGVNPPQCSWRQPLRVDGPKASERSIITHKINFCIDQAKTHREGRFWFDVSYDVTGVHRQMLRIKFCWFLFVFCRKLSHWDLVYKMAGCAARVT